MDLLLLQHAPWTPAIGGASRSNRFLLEGLAARGHTCRVIAPAVRPADEKAGPAAAQAQLVAELRARGITPETPSVALTRFVMDGVTVDALSASSALRGHLRRALHASAPTHVLVSCEDPFHLGLEVAVEEAPERTVYLARTTTALPFGPASSLPDDRLMGIVAKAGAIVATSDHIRDYVARHAGLASTTMHSPLYGSRLPPRRPVGEAVMMINPCAYKGIAIFLALARRFPEVPFVAVKGWGTTSADEAALGALPNVTVLPHTDDIDAMYARARVLVVPSLWDEAFGAVCVEAMMRGIPVIVSDSGGLPEAALGVGIVAPVAPITTYEPRLDERHLPIAVVPEQDVGPWVAALGRVLGDPAHAAALGDASRAAAAAFVERISIPRYERFFEGCFADRAAAADVAPEDPRPSLSPERTALLASWVRRRRQGRGPAAAPAPIDLEREQILDAAIRPTGPIAARRERILLTGATGFLGAWLLRGLLERTSAQVCCLVRADSVEAGRERLLEQLRGTGPVDAGWADRIVAEPGTLEAPALGLGERRFAELADAIDLVVHNGARVHFAWPYELLRPANVDGTREIVRLACAGRAKPLHLVSTLAVFPAGASDDGERIDEARPRAVGRTLVGGYAQSKWVAEGLALAAADRGLPVAIHRPAIIGGHSVTGAWSTGDLVCRLITASAQLGVFPRLDRAVYLAPVDFVADAIVASVAAGAVGVHHLLNPRPFPLRRLGEWLSAAGHPVALVPWDDFVAALAAARSGPAAELGALLPHLRAFAEDQLFATPRFDGAATADRLASLGLRCPPVDEAYVRRAVGWLADPHTRSTLVNA